MKLHGDDKTVGKYFIRNPRAAHDSNSNNKNNHN
jgi:hypothetical protein